MFNTISWQSYWITLAIFSVIYYLLIFFLYYGKDWSQFFVDQPAIREKQSFLSLDEKEFPEFTEPSKESIESVVYACIDELNSFFEEAKKRRWKKNELADYLRFIVKKYPSIKKSEYKSSVHSVISAEAEHICNIHFSQEDLDQVWLEL